MPTQLIPVLTRPLLPPKDDLFSVMLGALPSLAERDIVVVTSKVVAIAQGRAIPIEGTDKDQLIADEAEAILPKASSKYGLTLSIKENTLIASSGIDESNSNGFYTLWPTLPSSWAREAWSILRNASGVKELGVIVTDSHCTPLRWGVTGISIGFFGFKPLTDYRGRPDIFGRPLHYTQGNIADAISAAAVGIMGEADECTPIVVVRDWPRVDFVDYSTDEGFHISPEEDLFAPLLKQFIKVPKE